MTTKDKHKSFNYCFTDETGAQYSDLNLNQNVKGSNIFPIHSNSKLYNNKKIDSTFSESYEENKKLQTWKKLSMTNLSSNILNDENEKWWKKNDFLNATNNSTLSLHISAYENSNEASSDSRNESFQKSLLIQKQKQINSASTFFLKNPFEFQRQQNDKVPEPEISQFKASQQLLNLNKSDVNFSTETCEKPTIDEGTSEGLPIQKPKNTQFGPFPDNIVQKMIVTVINKQKDKKLGIRVARSLNVSSVQPGSAAEGILKAGDLILSLNGVKSVSRTQIEEQIPLITNGLFKFEIKRTKPPKMIESEGDVMKILPKAYDCAPGCRYIVGYICVYPGANLGIHIMSLDSKVYVTNAPYGTLAGDIFLIGDVVLTIDNIPVTTVKLCSSNIKEALCTKGWCRVLIERPVTQFAKQRTKNALKAEKCLEIDPKMPEDIMGICTQFLQNTAKSQIEATTTKGILKDRINPTWKSGKRVAISQQSEEVPVGCDPYNIDLMQQVEKRSEVPYQRKKNSSGVKKKSKLNFFGRKTAEENNNNP